MFKKPVTLAALLAATFGAQAANDSDLAAIRQQIDEMKKSYEQRIAALEEKLAQATAAPPPAERPVARSEAPAGGFNPEIGLTLQGQYKNMKKIDERRISGFFPAGGHAHGDEGIPGISRRGFSLDHSELSFAANIDPTWRGQAIFAISDGEVEVEEAWFQSQALGNGLGFKGGRFRSGIGYLNEQHAHAWDFADAPLMYRALFGDHGSYAQDGVQLKWLAPTPIYLEFGGEIGRGATFPGTDRNKNGAGAGALFVRLGDDIGASHSWRAGLSYLQTRAKEREAHFEDINGLEAQGLFTGRSRAWVADFVWKWAPDGNPKYRNFKLQAELFQRREHGELTCLDENGVGNACGAGGVTSAYRTRQTGGYVQAVYQFTPNWRAGLRYDQLDSGKQDFGINAANLAIENYRPKRVSAMVDYSWSEYSRLRLQFAQDKSMQGITDRQVTLQYIMNLGAHAAHKF